MATSCTFVLLLTLWALHGVAPQVPVAPGALLYLPASLIVLTATYLAHQGAVGPAARLYISFLWLGVTAAVILQGGLSVSVSVTGYITVVVCAGLLGGRRPLIWTSVFTLAATGLIAVGESSGWLGTPPAPLGTSAAFLSLAGGIAIVSLLILTARREVERSQSRLVDNRRMLQASLQEAREHRSTLERDLLRYEQLAELSRILSVSSQLDWMDEVSDHLRLMTGATEVGLSIERGDEMVSLLDAPDPELESRLRMLSGDLRSHGTMLVDREPGREASSAIFVSVSGRRVHGVMWLRRTEPLGAADVSFVSTVVSVVTGFLDRRRADQIAVEAQKLEAVGRLARSVAHDFNNVLTTLRSSTDLARDEIMEDAPARDLLDEIDKAGQHATALVAQLVSFTRREEAELVAVPAAKLVRELAPLLRRLAGQRHPLLLEIDPDVGRVRGDFTQLEQILLNLVANARDASRLGGRIWVRVTRDRSWVVLEVQDEGVGMTESVRRRAPEAFFTTKKQGTGLGLATAHDIAVDYGGRLSIESRPGDGTKVRIELPRVMERARAQRPLDLAR